MGVGVAVAVNVAVGIAVNVRVGGTTPVAVRVGVGPLVGGVLVFVVVGTIMIMLVGMEVCVLVGLNGMDVLVLVCGIGVNVLIGDDLGGIGVEKEAPGVRKTSIQAGLVRIDGSIGSTKPTGWFVRKSLFGLRFDPMFELNLQLGAKRSAHPLERMIQMNPSSRMNSMRTIESRLSLSRSRVFMETSIYGKTHKYCRARIGFFIMPCAFQPDAPTMSIDNAA